VLWLVLSCVQCQMYCVMNTYLYSTVLWCSREAVAIIVVVSEQLGCRVSEQLGWRVSEQQPGESVCEGRRFVWLMASPTALDITVLCAMCCVILCFGAG
jgi:hypothetical protein